MSNSSTTRCIYFFADGSQETQSGLRRILRSRSRTGFLSLFLDHCTAALRHDVSTLSAADRLLLPAFHHLQELLHDNFEESRRHPALHPVEIVLVQLATFIASFENAAAEPEAWPDPLQDFFVGVCFGELSAAAIGLSTGLAELIPLGVAAVRVAFWTGFYASITGDEIESRTSPAASWSTTISGDAELSNENVLRNLSTQIGFIGRSQPYVTFSGPLAVTIGGPPSTLDCLFEHASAGADSRAVKERQPVRIYAPYHSSTIYDREDVHRVLDNAASAGPILSEQPFPSGKQFHLGGAHGRHQVAENARQLIENVVYDILAEPIRMDKLTEACQRHIDSSEIRSWRVRPVSQTAAARSLTGALRSAGDCDIVLDTAFSLNGTKETAPTRFPIAIVGMAGRFPNANDPDELWDLLCDGIDTHKEVPSDRFDPSTHLERPAFGCFIDAPGLFDARFFNMSPREALQTDPGQRLALVTAYEALEMSGFVPGRTPSTRLERVGTFNGQVSDEYKEQNMAQEVGTYFIPGSMRSFGPGRINHFFKFGGPSISVDTACSTSSVAIHTACNSIWARECDTAVVGGMNIISSSDNYNGLTAGHFLSPTGGCKTFDDQADGYCRGEAVASIVIKPLDAALEDNDNVLATILAISSNYSYGSSSITHPWAPAQEKLYTTVLNDAAIGPLDVDYIEMHGTGTQAGDSVEMQSILNTFAPSNNFRTRGNPLAVGAVKANVGHGESASGITALIKALLVLREQSLPPHVGVKGTLNRSFPDLAQRQVQIPQTMLQLPSKMSQGSRRRVLVNNFSAAGGNTACIIEEFPAKAIDDELSDPRQSLPVAISAKSDSALRANVRSLAEYLQRNPLTTLSDLSYTTTARRMHHSRRFSAAVSSIEELMTMLETAASNEEKEPLVKPLKTCFVFTGQGAFHTQAATQLYKTCEIFRQNVLRYARISITHGFKSFLPLLEESSGDAKYATVAQTHLCAAAIQMALFRLVQSFGSSPDVLVGHSFGEYIALFASNVLSANEVLYLVGVRAQLLEERCKANTHSMLAVRASAEKVRKTLGPNLLSLEIACINSPRDVILTGVRDSIQQAAVRFKAESIMNNVLQLPFAYHSQQMDPILDDFEMKLGSLKFKEPKIPILSPLLKKAISRADILDPAYLRRHIRGCVDFNGAIGTYLESSQLDPSSVVWVEIGLHPTCLPMLKSIVGPSVRACSTLQKDGDCWYSLSMLTSFLYLNGYSVNWQELHRDFEKRQQLLHLPRYAWDEKNYWIPYQNNWLLRKTDRRAVSEDAPLGLEGPNTVTVQTLISEEVKDKIITHEFETDMARLDMYELVKGHTINGAHLCPASVYAEIALTIASFVRSKWDFDVPTSGMSVDDMEIARPIMVPREAPAQPQKIRITAKTSIAEACIHITYRPAADPPTDSSSAQCVVNYADSGRWKNKWAKGKYLIERRIQDLHSGVQNGHSNKLGRGLAYMLFASLVEYTPVYQGMDQVVMNSEDLEATASLRLSRPPASERHYCYPPWLDAIVQLSGFVMNANERFKAQRVAFISHGWRSFRLSQNIDPAKSYQVHVKMQPMSGQKGMYCGDLMLFESGDPVGLVKDLKFQQIPRSHLDVLLPSSLPVSSSKTEVIHQSASQKHRGSSTQAMLPNNRVNAKPHAPTLKKLETRDTPLLDSILNIMAAESGFALADIIKDGDFASLGIDSLLTLTIVSRARESLHVDLPRNVFYDYPNVKKLDDFLSQIQPAGADDKATAWDNDSDRSPQATPDTLTAPDSLLSHGRSDGRDSTALQSRQTTLLSSESRPVLRRQATEPVPATRTSSTTAVISKPPSNITKQTGPSRRSSETTSKQAPKPSKSLSIILQGELGSAEQILFMFPDGSGSATSYTKLPTISTSTCVIGLDSPHLRAGPDVDFSITDLVQTWAEEIRTRQPQGPYNFAGWSAGGYYAFEAYRLMIRAGETVERLILIDSPPRNVYEPIPNTVLDSLVKHKIMAPASSEQQQQQQPQQRPGKIRETPKWLSDHFACTIRALESYEPQPVKRGNFAASSGQQQLSPSPRVFIIWATDGVLDSGAHDPADFDLRTRVANFLLRPRTEFGTHGWDKLLPDVVASDGGGIVVAKVPGNHFSMVNPPNVARLASLIGSALEED